MFFNQFRAYRITSPEFKIGAAALEEALKTKPARKPESQELTATGFLPPFGNDKNGPLVVAADGYLLVCMRTNERILPGSVVRDELKDKVDEIEASQSRKVYKKERDQLKDEIIQALLPHTHIRRRSVFAAIAPADGLIFVDKASSAAAENILSTLRECLGSLPVRPVSTKIAPSATLTDWVKTGQAAEDFFLLSDARLEDTSEDGGSISAKNQDLTSETITAHIATGMLVRELNLAYQDKCSFVLDDTLSVKRLRFEDLLQDQAIQDGGDDAAGQFSASLVLMMKTLLQVVPALLTALGGEEVPEGI
ncbi:TPA: recombination-associated protein RdgC [Pseudomonas aeruginosa]|nr:recombination-associated protein RdgC [Pseudomonas aeruginosa]